MNTSFILNSKDSPVPISENLTTRVAMQENKQDTSNGTAADIDGCGLIVLQVTGTFVAKIIPQVFDSADMSGSFRNVTAVDTSDGSVVSVIEKPGIYEIRNTIGVKMRARVNSYTSGAVNVDATIIKSSILPVESAVKPRHELIASIRNRSVVASGESFILVEKDVSKYLFVYLQIVTDSAHGHHVYYKYSPNVALTIVGVTQVPINVIETSESRDCSEWVELKGGTNINMAIVNDDTESSHVYDIDIYGVM